ncbi:MAG: antA/AntB antirepressor family protein [Candidatus Competibacteraceae bacterium]|nr:antA/AntB antirepressor family protein [Candidatus Competibacteraceae bacterium]
MPRELHACLGVAAHFKDWIVRRIDDSAAH